MAAYQLMGVRTKKKKKKSQPVFMLTHRKVCGKKKSIHGKHFNDQIV